jgi:type IV pilus assembly protein PilA
MERLRATRVTRLLREEDGFTLIELMVVLVNIGVLIALALPTYAGARNRAHNRGAQVALRHTLIAARTSYVDSASYAGATTTGLAANEPNLTFVAAGTASSSANANAVSVATGAVNGNANQEFSAARMSPSGTCYTIDDVAVTGGTGAGNTVGVWYGTTSTAANCTGTWALANTALTSWP